MGKSTVLKSLFEKNRDKITWPVRIDLNEYSKLLPHLLEANRKPTDKKCAFDFNYFNISQKNYVELLLRTFNENQMFEMYDRCKNSDKKTFSKFLQESVISENQMTFENYVFLYMFFFNKVLIIFDGFDEISPTYSDLILKRIKKLITETNNRVWITSRPNFQDTLESNFGKYAYTLHPFSKHDQIEYLTNVWKQEWSGDFSEIMKNGIEKYTLALLQHFQKFVGNEYINYMGIPLKLKMMAEIFKENENCNENETWWGCFDYLKALNQGKVSLSDSITIFSYQKMNLFELYDIFIKKKFDRYLTEKVLADYTNSYGIKLKKIFCAYQYDIHKLLGLLQLTNEFKKDLKVELKHFMNEKSQNLVDEWIDDFKNGTENIGIVAKIIDDRPIFEHLTYAEYFSANLLIEHLTLFPEKWVHVFKILDTILKSNVPVFQYSIKYLLDHQISFAKRKILFKDTSIITFSTQHGFLNCVKFFINDKQFNNGFPREDKGGKTLLHHAVEHQHIPVVIHILCSAFNFYLHQNSIDYCYLMLKFFNVLDVYGKKAIDYASKNTEIYNILIDVQKSIENSQIFNFNTNFRQRNAFEKTSEHACIQDILQYATYTTIKHFLNNVPAIQIPDLCNLFDYLVTRNDLTESEKHQMFIFIWKQSINDSEKTYVAECALLSVIENDCLQFFKSIFLILEDHEFSHESLLNCLKCACKLKDIPLICFLCKKLKMYKHSNKFHALISGITNLEVLKCLDENISIKIEEKDAEGKTVILAALQKRCKLDIIKYLIEMDADINAKDINGISALTWAIETADDSIIKVFYKSQHLSPLLKNILEEYYRDKNFDINQKRNDKSRLHYAAIEENFEAALFLLQKGANVNITDDNGKTPLHFACENDCINIVIILLNFGAIYDMVDKNKKEPIDYCAENSAIIEILNKVKNDFVKVAENIISVSDPTTARNRDYKTLWHIAAENGNIDALKHLCNSIFALKLINEKNCAGNTALHLASKNGLYDVLLLLLENGAYYNLKNEKKETALEIAEKEKRFVIVNILKNIDYLFNARNLHTIKEELNLFKHISKYKDATGKTLLHCTVERKSLNDTQLLLNHNANINERDANNHAAVYYAIKNNDFAMLEILVKNRAILDIADFKKIKKNQCTEFIGKFHTLLSCANSEDINKLMLTIDLLKSDKHINLLLYALDAHEKNLLQYALEMNNYELVAKILENGAVINERLNSDNKKIMRLLKFIFKVFLCVEEKANVPNSILTNVIEHHGYQRILTNVQVEYESSSTEISFIKGRNFLNFAAAANNVELVKWCIKNGADCYKRDINGLNVFDVAKHYNNNDVLKFLEITFSKSSCSIC